jgi:hypothetical protein
MELPSTRSIEELAKFWDTHDLTEFDHELEEVTEPLFERLTAAIRPRGPKGNSPDREGGEQR